MALNTALMHKDVCIVIATIMPTLLVALIAERFVVRRGQTADEDRRRAIAALVRLFIDLFLGVAIAVEIALNLGGIETSGLHGSAAETSWNLAIFLFVAILYRWFLLSPPVAQALSIVAAAYARALRQLGESIAPLSTGLAGALTGVLEALFEVITGGMSALSSAIEHLTSIRGPRK